MATATKKDVPEAPEVPAPVTQSSDASIYPYKFYGPESLTEDQIGALMSNLNPKRIATRSQGGTKLSYLEAWDVRASLIRIFGFGGFDVETLKYEVFSLERDIPKTGGGTTAFRATTIAHVQLRIRQLDCVFSEVASSSQSGSVPGDVIDFALKTAVSDAMKRCAINLGTQFGLSLYNKGNTKDIVGLTFQPEQKAKLAATKVKADPTPDEAIEGVGSVDPETPASLDGPAEPEAEPDYVALASEQTDPEEVRKIWRRAKAAGAPESIRKNIATIGTDLQDAMDAAAAAKASAASQLASGFMKGVE